MSNLKRNGIGIGALTILIVAVFWLFKVIYQQPGTVDIVNQDPLYDLDATTFMELVGKNGEISIAPESVVEIKGVVKEINYLNNRVTILLEGSETYASHVICDMQSTQNDAMAQIEIRDTVTLKGVYKGFLKDAIFLNCLIAEQRP